jgi:hypothetical protein
LFLESGSAGPDLTYVINVARPSGIFVVDGRQEIHNLLKMYPDRAGHNLDPIMIHLTMLALDVYYE